MSGDPLYRAVGKIFIEVLGRVIRLRCVVIPHHRDELVHVRGHKVVAVIKAFITGPAVERSNLRNLIKRRVIPFTQCVVHVAFFLQVIGYGLGPSGAQSRCSPETPWRSRHGFRGQLHADCDRPSGRHVTASTVPWCGNCCNAGRCPPGHRYWVFDQAAKGTDLGKTGIIEQENDDIGRTLGRQIFGGPPLF